MLHMNHFWYLDPITKQYEKHYSINVTGVSGGAGIDSQEPFVFPAPGEDSGDGGGDGTEEEESGDDESGVGWIIIWVS